MAENLAPIVNPNDEVTKKYVDAIAAVSATQPSPPTLLWVDTASVMAEESA